MLFNTLGTVRFKMFHQLTLNLATADFRVTPLPPWIQQAPCRGCVNGTGIQLRRRLRRSERLTRRCAAPPHRRATNATQRGRSTTSQRHPALLKKFDLIMERHSWASACRRQTNFSLTFQNNYRIALRRRMILRSSSDIIPRQQTSYLGNIFFDPSKEKPIKWKGVFQKSIKWKSTSEKAINCNV